MNYTLAFLCTLCIPNSHMTTSIAFASISALQRFCTHDFESHTIVHAIANDGRDAMDVSGKILAGSVTHCFQFIFSLVEPNIDVSAEVLMPKRARREA